MDDMPHPDEQILPTRVIDVRGTPRLVLTLGRMTGRYAALSHCWGDPRLHPLKTTCESLPDHLNGIPISTMPQTFRDAVIISRNIGVPFLWIDSLCIVQDDEEDWKKESQLMGDFYQRAYFTIAATDSPDSYSGCFNGVWYQNLPLQSRQLPFYRCSSSSSRLKPAGTFNIGLDWRHPHWKTDMEPPFDWGDLSRKSFMISDDSGLGSSVLQSRGWVTQEWILSRRVIHYRTDRIIWHCQVAGEEDCGAEWDGTQHHVKVDWEFWRYVVEAHSARNFTFPKDKLISLLGLVSALKKHHEFSIMRPQFQGEHRFGLWAQRLNYDLLWVPIGIRADPHHSSCPSWSWASRLGVISCGIGTSGFHAEEAPETKIQFSKSSQQTLRVKSRAKVIEDIDFQTAMQDGDEINEDGAPPNNDSKPRSFFEDLFYLPFRPETGGLHAFHDELGEELGWICLDDGNFEDSMLGDGVLFLSIGPSKYHFGAWSRWHEREFGHKVMFWGIIAQPTDGGSAYRRIGIGMLAVTSWLDDTKVMTYSLV
jgi:hypothetical protein